jgi:hypothetical protein
MGTAELRQCVQSCKSARRGAGINGLRNKVNLGVFDSRWSSAAGLDCTAKKDHLGGSGLMMLCTVGTAVIALVLQAYTGLGSCLVAWMLAWPMTSIGIGIDDVGLRSWATGLAPPTSAWVKHQLQPAAGRVKPHQDCLLRWTKCTRTPNSRWAPPPLGTSSAHSSALTPPAHPTRPSC